MLWTNVENSRRGNRLAGTAEVPAPRGDKWQQARSDCQLRDWFKGVPNFLITIDAECAAEYSDARFCALVEHELLHCAQSLDHYGSPRFNLQTGEPVFGLRGHDFEGFVSITRRYGVGSAEAGVSEVVAASALPPLLAAEDIAGVCGSCV